MEEGSNANTKSDWRIIKEECASLEQLNHFSNLDIKNI